jgi:hypothetical protein
MKVAIRMRFQKTLLWDFPTGCPVLKDGLSRGADEIPRRGMAAPQNKPATPQRELTTPQRKVATPQSEMATRRHGIIT